MSYNTLQSQEAFLMLPEENKNILIGKHHELAKALNGPKTIEIAGKKILAMPLETMALTPEKQKKFEEAGGLMNPAPKVATADKNQDKMMYWAESFETLQAEIDGTLYRGFDLFKKVYEAFPDIRSMTKDEATESGLYPIIHYRNFAARKWMAKMNGGHIATLDENYNGELRDIYDAAPGRTNLEKLAAIGQAPLGGRFAGISMLYGFGEWARLGSDSLNGDGIVRVLYAHRNKPNVVHLWDWQEPAVSSVVVLDK